MAEQFTINLNVTASKAPSTEQDKLRETTDSNSGSGETGDKEKDMAKAMFKGLSAKKAYSFVIGSAQRIASNRIGSIGERYGDEALQNRISNVYNGVASGLSTATMATITLGSGNYIAFAMSMISAALQSAMDITNRMDTMRIEDQQEQRSIQRRSERLGIVASKGGRR